MNTLNRTILEAALVGLEAQKERTEAQIAQVRAMLPSRPGEAATSPEAPPRKRRKMSAAGRKAIAEAQGKRWAEAKKATEPAPQEAAKPKRKLSRAGRAAIVADMKKRWRLQKAAAKAQSAAKKAAPGSKKAAVEKAAVKAAKKSAPVKKAAVKKAATPAPVPVPAVE